MYNHQCCVYVLPSAWLQTCLWSEKHSAAASQNSKYCQSSGAVVHKAICAKVLTMGHVASPSHILTKTVVNNYPQHLLLCTVDPYTGSVWHSVLFICPYVGYIFAQVRAFRDLHATVSTTPIHQWF